MSARELIVGLAVLAAACGKKGGSSIDGGSAGDAGVATDGGSRDAGTQPTTCTSNQDCRIASRCNQNINRCESDVGGIGAPCPQANQNLCAVDGQTICVNIEVSEFCTRDCQSTNDCPRDYECNTIQFTNGPRKICIPKTSCTSTNDTADECDTSQYCLRLGTPDNRGYCVNGDNCRPFDQNCLSANDACIPLQVFSPPDKDATICRAAGTAGQGQPCSNDTRCQKGFVCAQLSTETGPTCKHVCDPNLSGQACQTSPDPARCCSGGTRCVITYTGSPIGICIPGA